MGATQLMSRMMHWLRGAEAEARYRLLAALGIARVGRMWLQQDRKVPSCFTLGMSGRGERGVEFGVLVLIQVERIRADGTRPIARLVRWVMSRIGT